MKQFKNIQTLGLHNSTHTALNSLQLILSIIQDFSITLLFVLLL